MPVGSSQGLVEPRHEFPGPSSLAGTDRQPEAAQRAKWPRFDARPYLERQWSATFTCWHLVIEFYERELGIIVPRYGADRYERLSGVQRAWAFRAARKDGLWREVDATAERFGDVVTFWSTELPPHMRRLDMHAGVVIGPGRMINVIGGEETSVERHDGVGQIMQRLAFYRHLALVDG